MMEIYYLNAKGEKLNLTEWPYRIQTGDILNYKNLTYFRKLHMVGKFLDLIRSWWRKISH